MTKIINLPSPFVFCDTISLRGHVMGKKRILLATGSESLLPLEKMFANRKKFDVIVARDGCQAFEMIKHEKPELSFLNLHLPGMSGDACCQAVKWNGLCLDTTIVLLPSAGRPEELERCINSGCDAVLQKPIDHVLLAETVTRFLFSERRREQRYVVHLNITYGLGQRDLASDFTVNLSTGGIFLKTRTIYPVETMLCLGFTLPGEDTPITCRARVAWINGPEPRVNPLLPAGMGLQFLSLESAEVNTIRRFISAVVHSKGKSV